MKITEERFSYRFRSVMNHYGITNVGEARKFLSVINPNARLWSKSMHHFRARRIQRELEEFYAER